MDVLHGHVQKQRGFPAAGLPLCVEMPPAIGARDTENFSGGVAVADALPNDGKIVVAHTLKAT
jgi:hypothetical protein